jgi:3D (Asp-Asp-Asp) domain-containing protein
MSREKRIALRRRISLIRTVIIVAGFGCVMHLAHRECARISYKSIVYSNLSNNSTVSEAGEAEVFDATAYCVSGITKSGAVTAPGCVATDPKVIPLGSMIYVDSPLMGGIYQVLDTGSLIKGKIIDIFIPNYDMCREFGRRSVKVKVLRYGFLGYAPQKDAGM